MHPLNNAGLFLVEVVFGLYLIVLLLRLVLQWVNAPFYNPVSQFVFKLTNPLLMPLERIIPKYGKLDNALLLLILVTALIKQGLVLGLMPTVAPFNIGLLSIWAIAEIANQLLNVFFYAILIRAVLSWLNPSLHNPMIVILYYITEPILSRARQWIPPISGIDLSPLVMLVLIKLTAILLIYPLYGLL